MFFCLSVVFKKTVYSHSLYFNLYFNELCVN